jgi:hypothetical protein
VGAPVVERVTSEGERPEYRRNRPDRRARPAAYLDAFGALADVVADGRLDALCA